MRITSESTNITYDDLVKPSKETLYKTFSDLLDIVVAQDGNVTRSEEQLDQLCDLILLKLDSDKQGKTDRKEEVYFRKLSTASRTAKYIKEKFKQFTEVYPDIFAAKTDQKIRFEDTTIYNITGKISQLNFLDIGADTVSMAFQVLRSAALKQKEGQYFTPKQVIQAAIRLLEVSPDDIIIDPACGTGGFLIQCLADLKDRYPDRNEEISKWSESHIYGIDKDPTGVKLTMAVLQISGDGSAHCERGDSVLTHTWETKYPHLLTDAYKNGRFTKVFTNPPFGSPLKIKYSEAKNPN